MYVPVVEGVETVFLTLLENLDHFGRRVPFPHQVSQNAVEMSKAIELIDANDHPADLDLAEFHLRHFDFRVRYRDDRILCPGSLR